MPVLDLTKHIKLFDTTGVFHRYDFKDLSLDEFVRSVEIFTKTNTVDRWIIDSSLDVFDYLPAPLDQTQGARQGEPYGLVSFFEICAVKFGALAQPYHIIHADYDIVKKYDAWKKMNPQFKYAESVHYSPVFFNILSNSESKFISIDSTLPLKDYCVFVNREKPERIQLLQTMSSHNSLSNAYYSWNFTDELWHQLQIPYKKRVLPAESNVQSIESYSAEHAHRVREDMRAAYSAVHADLAVETSYHCRFITEKTVRPLLYGMPFLVLAAPGHLAMLRELGFETFPELWDESYDTIADTQLRINALVNQLHPVDKHRVIDKLQHNRQLALKLGQTDWSNHIAQNL